uniref:Ribonuclease P protein subunit p20 n=1 Tax=Cuerna arida TaxID=1464854 RepID=A0A1B6EPU9_9HEMI
MADDGVKNKKAFSKKTFNSAQPYHSIRKRNPPHLRHNNDIYITNKSNFQGQLTQCEKLIGEGESEIVLHGIGAAIQRTINLALQLNEKYQGSVELHVETSTVTLVDDLEPLTDSADYETQTRQNSSIVIRVVKNKNSPVNQL